VALPFYARRQSARLIYIKAVASPENDSSGMKQPDDEQAEEPIRTEAPRQAEARRTILEYIETLREVIRKLRGKPH